MEVDEKDINEVRRQIQNESLKALKKNDYNGWIILPTGSGKSYVMVEILKRLNPTGKIWFLVNSTEIRDITFRNELMKWGAVHFIHRIEFMCYQTAYKRRDEEVDLVLCDEGDYLLTPQYSKSILNNNFKHKVLVTATLYDEKRKLAEKIAPIVYEKSLAQIEGKGLLNETRYYFVNYMLTKEENKEYLSYNAKFAKLLNREWRSEKQLEMLQIQRKHFLSSLDSSRNVCRRLLNELYQEEGNKILVFCGLNDQADRICKYSYHSKSEENWLNEFDEGKIRVLSTVNKVNRGVNLKGVNNIVHEAPGKSRSRSRQQQGRGKRLPVDQTTSVYFLIPYYKDKFGGRIKPSCVLSWVEHSIKDLNVEVLTHKLKK